MEQSRLAFRTSEASELLALLIVIIGHCDFKHKPPPKPTLRNTKNHLNMRATSRLLALPSSVGTQSSGLKPVPLALLPPIPLYRRLLRAHRKFLPHEMRVLGDQYVKSEFRLHRNVDNPVHIVGFLTEWQMYAQQIEGNSWRGEKIDKTKVDKMSGESLLCLCTLAIRW